MTIDKSEEVTSSPFTLILLIALPSTPLKSMETYVNCNLAAFEELWTFIRRMESNIIAITQHSFIGEERFPASADKHVVSHFDLNVDVLAILWLYRR